MRAGRAAIAVRPRPSAIPVSPARASGSISPMGGPGRCSPTACTRPGISTAASSGCAGLWGTIGFVTWANALLTKHFGFAPAVSGGVLTVVGVAAFFSKPLIGWASDLMPRYRRHLAVGCLSTFAVVLLVFGFCSTLTQFYLVAPLLGIAGYGYLAILIAQITNVAGATSAGSAAGISNAFWQLGGAIAPIAVGYTFAGTGSFLYALVVVAMGPVIAAVTLLFMRRDNAATPHGAAGIATQDYCD